jgi:hypothetical protein
VEKQYKSRKLAAKREEEAEEQRQAERRAYVDKLHAVSWLQQPPQRNKRASC